MYSITIACEANCTCLLATRIARLAIHSKLTLLHGHDNKEPKTDKVGLNVMEQMQCIYAYRLLIYCT